MGSGLRLRWGCDAGAGVPMGSTSVLWMFMVFPVRLTGNERSGGAAAAATLKRRSVSKPRLARCGCWGYGSAGLSELALKRDRKGCRPLVGLRDHDRIARAVRDLPAGGL